MRRLKFIIKAVLTLVLLLLLFNAASAFEVEMEYDPSPAEAFQEIEFKAVVKGAERRAFYGILGTAINAGAKIVRIFMKILVHI